MNAQNKGLDTEALFISEIIANKGSSQWRYGRQRRRQMKRTNLKIVVEELEQKPQNKTAKPVKEKILPKEIKEAPKEKAPEEKPKVEKKEVPKEKAPKVEEKLKETAPKKQQPKEKGKEDKK